MFSNITIKINRYIKRWIKKTDSRVGRLNKLNLIIIAFKEKIKVKIILNKNQLVALASFLALEKQDSHQQINKRIIKFKVKTRKKEFNNNSNLKFKIIFLEPSKITIMWYQEDKAVKIE